MTASTPNSEWASEVLNQCLSALETGQAEVNRCVAQFPDVAELKQLLLVALTVRQLPRPLLPVAPKWAIQQQVLARYRALLSDVV